MQEAKKLAEGRRASVWQRPRLTFYLPACYAAQTSLGPLSLCLEAPWQEVANSSPEW